MLTERPQVAGKEPWPAMYQDETPRLHRAGGELSKRGDGPTACSISPATVWEWTESAYCPYDKRLW